MADEKLVRVHNLKALLKARHVDERERARHLAERLGGLIADCQNQMELAAGNAKAAKLGIWGHALKHFFDFTPPSAS